MGKHLPSGTEVRGCQTWSSHQAWLLTFIWLVPPVNDQDDFLEATVTIKLTDKAKETYVQFLGGSTETTVRHVKLFYSLVKKLELVIQYDAKTKIVKDNEALIKELAPNTDSSPSDEIQQKKT